MTKIISVIILILAFSLLTSKAIASNEPPEIGIQEKLGDKIPLDLKFTDSEGKEWLLKDLFDKPVVLSLVYYHCPGICSPLLTGLGEVVDGVDLKPGEDFRVLSISFNHAETPADAKKWKNNYLKAMKRPIADSDWTFMVGDSASIRTLTDAVGFYFKPDGKGDFIHTGSIFVLNKQGMISRYLFGTQFLPFDLKMSIIEASQGKSSPTINKMLAFCFSYDPEGKTYVFNITKVAGTVIFLSLGIFLAVLLIKGRKNKSK